MTYEGCIVFLSDSTGPHCPRKPRDASHSQQNLSESNDVESVSLAKKQKPNHGSRTEFLVSCSFRPTNNPVANALLPGVTAICPLRQLRCYPLPGSPPDHLCGRTGCWCSELYSNSLFTHFCLSLRAASMGSVLSVSPCPVQGLAQSRQWSVLAEQGQESCFARGTHHCVASAHKIPITSPWVSTRRS